MTWVVMIGEGLLMERYVISGGVVGFERLQLLAGLRLPDTRRLLDRVGVQPGWSCVDLGSGSGDITAELARRVGPGGHVTGLDMDATKVALAAQNTDEAGLSWLRFQVADLTTWAPTEEYDLVYCGLVLQHLVDPVALLRRMREAVRPGGVVVVEDADFDGLLCWPPDDGFAFYADHYREVLRRRGGEPRAGLLLCQWFLEAGFADPHVTLVQRADREGPGKSISLSTLVTTAQAIADEGLASQEEIDEAIRQLTAYTADPTTVIVDPRIFQVWATR